MGTRHVTGVLKDGEYKIAQYGQWDGYPEGQGNTILKFLRNKKRVAKLKKTLDKVRFTNEADEKESEEWFDSIGSKNGWLNMDQAKLYKEKYPLRTRDNGAEILQMVIDRSKDDEIVLLNSTGDLLSKDSWIEWAYVIDFDENKLKIYRGGGQDPYHEYSLDEIPTIKQLVADVEYKEDEW